ncbi:MULTISPECIES: TetR/AcrR family transcriptional regulator [Acetobacter]|uniref:TetR/AcrR family transcriptional regulator n=2 Tax=Acetobacter TaxID=434 RepID=A0AAN1PHL7_9PROT|nr:MULTISPECIES: TetR/AcrR family transcriptional regulator [Acetobacter]ASL40237.1 TetR family transcriptional regulator [Acetobacter oryzifermentans]AXN00331.1 TetR/AcrR family transcriptional regulator [Acetobacter pomorum]KAA8394307.1 TetR/AcrR family transcriptional regulator [Acetobacter sp. DmW_125127]KAA8395215.1 TetR/AcrR family transcriptional regulator [Acetobacter sp. DmW_125128]KAA8395302.1 TetR/AcrR family transcriptional regulator [Acetobacter sp. DmW_125124]
MTSHKTRTNNPESVKSNLLDAAAEILIHESAQKLTLNLVAQKAGVSKGGLLHHFPSKEKLLDGLFHRELNFFRDEIQAAMEKDPVATGRAARAYIGLGNASNPQDKSYIILRQLLSIMLSDNTLSQEWTRIYWQTIKSTGLFEESSPLMILCCLAADGLSLWEILGADKLNGINYEDIQSIIEKITYSKRIDQ